MEHESALEIQERLDDADALAARDQDRVLPPTGDETLAHGGVTIYVLVVDLMGAFEWLRKKGAP